MLGLVERYRRYHLSCLNKAQGTDDPRVKKQMLATAELWKELAEKEQNNWNDPVYRAKQRSAERERKLAEIAAIIAFNRSYAAHFDQSTNGFAGEQLQRVLKVGLGGCQ
jgi:hypothetical protein